MLTKTHLHATVNLYKPHHSTPSLYGLSSCKNGNKVYKQQPEAHFAAAGIEGETRMPALNINRKEIKQPPGTLQYTGSYHVAQPQVELIRYNADGITRQNIPDIKEIHNDPDSIQWLNIIGLSDTSLIKTLGEMFGIHRINLEDIVDVSQRSKMEINEQYLFSIFKMFYLENTEIISEHVSLVIVGNILITFQEKPGDIFDTVRLRLKLNQGIIRHMDIAYLFFCLVDRFVDEYFISLQHVENRFIDIEAAVIDQGSTGMDAIYRIRKDLLYLKNGISPLKDILEMIIREDMQYFSDETKKYFADVYDNAAKVHDAILTYREMVNGLYEAQVANRNDDMNQKIMTLTVISVIFIPLSFIAGVFGMNFTHMPLLSYRYSFVIFMAACVCIVSGMLIFFKRKKWF